MVIIVTRSPITVTSGSVLLVVPALVASDPEDLATTLVLLELCGVVLMGIVAKVVIVATSVCFPLEPVDTVCGLGDPKFMVLVPRLVRPMSVVRVRAPSTVNVVLSRYGLEVLKLAAVEGNRSQLLVW